MLIQIKQLLSPPLFEDKEKSYSAGIINIIVLTVLAASILTLVSTAAFSTLTEDTIVLLGIAIVSSLVALWILRRGYLKLAGTLVALMISGVVTYSLFTGDNGIRSELIVVYLASVVIAGLVLGRQGVMFFILLTLAAVTGLFVAETQGAIISQPLPPIGLNDLVTIYILIGLPSVMFNLLIGQYANSLTRARLNEQALAASNRQLQAIRASLEEQVAARTRRLATVATLNERLSAILDVEQLLAELVQAVKDHFGYYHVHIYLFDERRANLVVAAGTGPAGAEMKAQRHSIPLNSSTSLVARAARSGEIVNVENVRETENWLPNPLLPETCAEMAVPIILEQQVIGVLDVQEDEVSALDEGDANLLRSLANQVAVAIRNANLFAEVQQALAEVRLAQQRFLEQSWQAVNVIEQSGRHLAISASAPPLGETEKQRLAQAKDLALNQQRPALVFLTPQPQKGERGPGDEGLPSLVAPIKFQNTPIGILQMHPLPDSQSWQEDDFRVIEVVLEQLGRMAENIRLTEANRKRATREQTIRHIVESMRGATSLEDLVKITATALGERLSAGHAVVELGVEAPSENGHNS